MKGQGSAVKREEAIKSAIAASRAQILGFLKDLVECNSYVHNKAGVERVAERVAPCPGAESRQ